jgi:hypothetical protein
MLDFPKLLSSNGRFWNYGVRDILENQFGSRLLDFTKIRTTKIKPLSPKHSLRVPLLLSEQTHSAVWSYCIAQMHLYLQNRNYTYSTTACGPGSVIGIATGYGLDGPGIESQWGARFSAPVQTGPGAHPTSCINGYRVFPGGKERPARDADPSPPSNAVVMKG